MGREIRRVPANWVHPKDPVGNRGHACLHEGTWLRQEQASWDRLRDAWGKFRAFPASPGNPFLEHFRMEFDESLKRWPKLYSTWDREKHATDMANGCWDFAKKGGSQQDWCGQRPLDEDHMPVWDPAECTHYQFYENVTEGTPLSPVLDRDGMIRWLVFEGYSERKALEIVDDGRHIPSFVMKGDMISGTGPACANFMDAIEDAEAGVKP